MPRLRVGTSSAHTRTRKGAFGVLGLCVLGSACGQPEDESLAGEGQWPPHPGQSTHDGETDATDGLPSDTMRPDRVARRPCVLGSPSHVAADGDCHGREPCFSDLQGAIDRADFGTMIWVYPGTYAPTTGDVVAEVTKTLLCVVSVEGPEATVLDARGRGTAVRAGYDGALWLEGFTIHGGAPQGGSDLTDGFAIEIRGWSNLRGWIVDNIVEDHDGGALSVTTNNVRIKADVLISGNRFLRNASKAPGGSVELRLSSPRDDDRGLVRIENNLFVSNDGSALVFGDFVRFHDEGTSPLRVQVVNNTITGSETGLRAAVDEIEVSNNVIFGALLTF
jgi:hypothetical protein